MKIRLNNSDSNKEIKLLSLQLHNHNKIHDIINVGFPIAALGWAYRIHDQNSCVEYLAVGLCSIDFAEEGDELSKLTRKSLNLDYLQISMNNGIFGKGKSNGHIMIYQLNYNSKTTQFDNIHLC